MRGPDSTTKAGAMISDILNAGPFWSDDQPAVGPTVELDIAPDDYTLLATYFDGEEYGEPVPLTTGETSYDINWPDAPFTAGEHVLSIVAQNRTDDTVTSSRREGSARVFVMDDDGWHTLDSAREEWSDAPRVDATLWDFLTAARNQVIDFGRRFGVEYEPGSVPTNWRTAQFMQTKALYQKNRANQDDSLNAGSYGVTIYPMDKTIRSTIRPKRGTPWTLGAPYV